LSVGFAEFRFGKLGKRQTAYPGRIDDRNDACFDRVPLRGGDRPNVALSLSLCHIVQARGEFATSGGIINSCDNLVTGLILDSG
jgi:hypothetical protein